MIGIKVASRMWSGYFPATPVTLMF